MTHTTQLQGAPLPDQMLADMAASIGRAVEFAYHHGDREAACICLEAMNNLARLRCARRVQGGAAAQVATRRQVAAAWGHGPASPWARAAQRLFAWLKPLAHPPGLGTSTPPQTRVMRTPLGV